MNSGVPAGVKSTERENSLCAPPFTGRIRERNAPQGSQQPSRRRTDAWDAPKISQYLLPSVLPVIRPNLPELRLYLHKEMIETLLYGLNLGRLDLVLIALPFETGSHTVMPLLQDRSQQVSPRDWPAPHGIKGLLHSGQLMLLGKCYFLQRDALQAYPRQISVSLDRFVATSRTTLIAMMSEGLNVTHLPNRVINAGMVNTAIMALSPLPDACPRRVALA